MTIKEYVVEKKKELKKIVETFGNRECKLTIIQVNDDQASNTYVRGKLNDCVELGIEHELIKLPLTSTKNDVLQLLNKINNPVIVQLPLPNTNEFINGEEFVKQNINPKYDVDGFSPTTDFIPCTPGGIIDYLDYIKYDFTGKNALVIGRSNIVGKPMAKLLLDKNMNITIIHSKTTDEDKARYIENADLIVVATGHINTLHSNYKYKETALIVDVGINIDENGKLIGDCERNLPVKLQTPVPGGVGLLTRLKLLNNVCDYYSKRYVEEFENARKI